MAEFQYCRLNTKILFVFPNIWISFPGSWSEYVDLRKESITIEEFYHHEALRCNSPYSIRIQEITDQKKLRIWTLFTQCILFMMKRFAQRYTFRRKTVITQVIVKLDKTVFSYLSGTI